jgi:hypothetical protein
MNDDFPAAHSMDTYWFAVDRDGRVAVFDSGEAGAVPASAGVQEDRSLLEQFAAAAPWSLAEFQRALGDADPSSEPHPALEAELTERAVGQDDEEDMFDFDSTWTLMFLESAEPLRQEIDRRAAVALPATEGVAVLVKNLTRPLADRLHQAGACLGCFGPYDYEELPTLLGLYAYDHSCENWISGPYDRRGVPIRDLRADQLPPEVREQVEGMRFASLCFAEAEQIQPVDHADCHSWQSAYLDLDGKTIRPLPGREDEFREQYRPSDIGRGYRIEPPAE